MAVRKFQPLKPAQPEPVAVVKPVKPVKPRRIQTSVRMETWMYRAVNTLAASKYAENPQQRVTVHDLIIEGILHVLEINGIDTPKR